MRWLKQWYYFFFSPQRQFCRRVYHLTGLRPANPLLYRMAFTHASASPDIGFNNERLELVGDAVFDVIISEFLYFKYPLKSEGFLTEMRSKIVSRKTINEVARAMDLQDYLETTMSDKHLLQSSTLGNAFEALIGAIYFDLGFKQTKKFVIEHILRIYFDVEELESMTVNFKSKLIQYSQQHNIDIRYETLQEEKTKRGRKYTMGVYLDDQLMGSATAYSKKAAEQTATQQALEKLGQSS